MQDQPRLLSVVLRGRHEDCSPAARISAFADESKETTGRAEPTASIRVENFTKVVPCRLAFHDPILARKYRRAYGGSTTRFLVFGSLLKLLVCPVEARGLICATLATSVGERSATRRLLRGGA